MTEKKLKNRIIETLKNHRNTKNLQKRKELHKNQLIPILIK